MLSRPSKLNKAARSEGQYQREGERLLRRAIKLFPHLPHVEALIEEAGWSPIIEHSTLRRYKPSYYRALVIAGSVSIGSDFERLCVGLAGRAGKPQPPQTASNKVTDASRAEAEATFQHLKRLVMKRKGRSAMAAGLYVLVAPRIGIRPIELLDASVSEQILRIRTAKRRDGKSYRELRLNRFAPTFIEALKWLCVLAQEGTKGSPGSDAEERFQSWRNRVAEALARASYTATGRRLSLYSFRHVALASWKSHGFSAHEIATMAGHLQLKSAGHYAAGRHGWSEVAVASPVMPQEPQDRTTPMFPRIRQTRPDPGSPAPAEPVIPLPEDDSRTTIGQPDFVFEDFPMPEKKPPAPTSGIDARATFERKADEVKASADRLEAATLRRPRGEPDNRKGAPRKR
ncbi:hypothetical protein [Devosia sp. LjRoot3]|uniref:hypothetical protein n=1 Tax=Devosia sp. LjRoot3 TaxID=3342319 RepID=UPI003ED159CE